MLRRVVVCVLVVLQFTSLVEAREVRTPPAAQSDVRSDVRVLIDISGSMKQNDPHNLRIPALNLLTQLLPDGHRAGVWTFGQQVNHLIPHGNVDTNWRALARSKAQQINSVGLFTNIGGVLEKSFADHSSGRSFAGTHFILLTDGVVDIAKDPARNAQERERIINEVLPRFREAGAKIHTVALSRHADHMLLERLALDTQGLNAVAESPEDLNRIFVQMLDQAAPAEKVPLTGNTFDIDASIEEFTALVFTKAGAEPVALVGPDGRRYAAADAGGDVRWYRDRGYDLVTVVKPAAGEWTILADLDVGSRITVVTNLRMAVSPLPAHFYPGDELALTASFFEDDQQVLDAGFLGLVDVDVRITNEEDLSGTKRISRKGQPPEDGIYRDSISKLRRLGRYSVTVLADGKTFKREHTQVVQLQAPVEVELEGVGQGADSFYRLRLLRRSDNVLATESHASVSLKLPDGRQEVLAVPFFTEKNRWELEIRPTAGDGQYLAQISLDGMVKGGRPFQLQPGAVSLQFPRLEGVQTEYRSLVTAAVAEQSVAAVAAVAQPAEEVSTPSAESLVDLAQAAADASQSDESTQADGSQPEVDVDSQPESGGLPWIWIGLAGIILAGGAGAWWWKRRGASAQAADRENVPKQNETPDQDSEQTIDLSEEAVQPTEADASGADNSVDEAVTASAVAQAMEEEWMDDMGMDGDSTPLREETPAAEEFDVSEPDELVMPNIQADAAEAEPDLSPDEIADRILAENQQMSDDIEEEFNLEDFDISEPDPASAKRDS